LTRQNIYARLQRPWLVMTWVLAIIGLLMAAPFLWHLSEGWLVLTAALVLMLVWVTRINPRASLVDDKEEAKRKHKHPAYKKEKGS